MEAGVKGVLARCHLALLGALALQLVALVFIVRASGAPIDAGVVVRSLCVLGIALLAVQLVLRPLRADLRALEALASRELTSSAQALIGTAHTRESALLFEAVAFLCSRSTELERVEAEARAAAQDSERLRASFVAAMAHDLRGPLNAILGFSDLMVMEGHETVSPAQRPSVEIIRRSAQDLLVLLNQILDWAKLDAGLIKLTRTPLQIEAEIIEAAQEAQSRSADRGLQVQLDVAHDLPLVSIDGERVRQALLGLMDNATRVPDRPRVVVSARLHSDGGQNPRIRIELHDPQLAVREADQGSFFEPFRPSYAPSGRRVGGLGLGPALGRALIRAHGGSVWFVSHAGTGTTFSVEIPIDAE
jgi:signal transduction histidine kinase